MDLGDYGLCPICLENGISIKLLFFHLNLTEACLMCPDPKCPYPLVENGVEVILQTTLTRDTPGEYNFPPVRGLKALEDPSARAELFDLENFDLTCLGLEEKELIKMINSLEIACATVDDEELFDFKYPDGTKPNPRGSDIAEHLYFADASWLAKCKKKFRNIDKTSEKSTKNDSNPQTSAENKFNQQGKSVVGPEQQPTVSAMGGMTGTSNQQGKKEKPVSDKNTMGKTKQQTFALEKPPDKTHDDLQATSHSENKDSAADRISLEELLGNDLERFLNDLHLSDLNEVVTFDQNTDDVLLECLDISSDEETEEQHEAIKKLDTTTKLQQYEDNEGKTTFNNNPVPSKMNGKFNKEEKDCVRKKSYTCADTDTGLHSEYVVQKKTDKKKEQKGAAFIENSSLEKGITQKSLQLPKESKEFLAPSKPWDKYVCDTTYGSGRNVNHATCGTHCAAQSSRAMTNDHRGQIPVNTASEGNGSRIFKNSPRLSVSPDTFLSRMPHKKPTEKEHKSSRAADVKDIFRNTLSANYTKAKRIPMARAAASANSKESNSKVKDTKSGTASRTEPKETSAVANLLNLLIKTSCADDNGDKTDELEAVEAQLLSHFKKAPITYCRLNTIKAACKQAASVAAEGKLAVRVNTDAPVDILQHVQKPELNQATSSSVNGKANGKSNRNVKSSGKPNKGQLIAQTQSLFKEMDQGRVLKSKCFTPSNAKTRKESKIYPNPFYQEPKECNQIKGSKCTQCGKPNHSPDLLQNNYADVNSYKFCYGNAIETSSKNGVSVHSQECQHNPAAPSLKNVACGSPLKVGKDQGTMTEIKDQIQAVRYSTMKIKDSDVKAPSNLQKTGPKGTGSCKGSKIVQSGKVKISTEIDSKTTKSNTNKNVDFNSTAENFANDILQAAWKTESNQLPQCSFKETKAMSKSHGPAKEKTVANEPNPFKSVISNSTNVSDAPGENKNKMPENVKKKSSASDVSKDCQVGKAKASPGKLQKNDSSNVKTGANKNSPKKGQKVINESEIANIYKEAVNASQTMQFSNARLGAQEKKGVAASEKTNFSTQGCQTDTPPLPCLIDADGEEIRRGNLGGVPKRSGRSRRRRGKEENKNQ